jgi:hypothetical protein
MGTTKGLSHKHSREGITVDRELRKTKTRRLPVYDSFSTIQRTPSPNSFLDGTTTVSLSDPFRGLYHLLSQMHLGSQPQPYKQLPGTWIPGYLPSILFQSLVTTHSFKPFLLSGLLPKMTRAAMGA